MTNVNYNLKRHIELLKQKQKTLNEKKSFLKENPKESLELAGYSAQVSIHLEWENRLEISSLMQDFLSNKLDGEEFYYRVIVLRHRKIDECEEFLSKLISEEIKDFYPNKNAFKFRGFLSNLFFECSVDFDIVVTSLSSLLATYR